MPVAFLGSQLLARQGAGGGVDIPSFRRDFATVKTLDHGIGPSITFTRTGTATYFDSAGVLTTATADVPRFDHDPSTLASKGLLIEESRTNSIRNSQAGGATVGVIGSGGALPTNWATGSVSGISYEVIGTGTVSGFSYLDLKISGTNSSGSSVNPIFSFEATTVIVASSAQSWTGSCYIALQAGSLAGASSFNIDVTERDSGGAFLAASATGFTPTSALTRISHSRTFSNASTARTNHRVYFSVANGNSIDLTLRIAAPQLEQGAFATSYIPTTNAAVTRGADSAVVTPISSFYNASEGTIYNEFTVPVLDGASTLRGITQFAEAAATQNRLQTGVRGTGLYSFSAVAANSVEFEINTLAGAVTSGATVKAAQVYKSGDSARSFNGAAVGSSSAAITQPTRERLRFGDNGSAILNGHIRKVAYYPKRLSNERLRSLTT